MGIASIGMGCHTMHGAGPYPDFADVVAEALLGPEWAYWHHHHHASEPHPWWCDGDHAFEDEDEGEHTWDDDPYAHEGGGVPALGDPASEVLFEAGSAELTPAAEAHLRRVAELVREDPEVELLLRGHSDGSGEEGFDLSDQRARSVREFLAGEGVSARRIAWVGLGDSQPVASDGSADGRRRNRRVEIVVREREPDPYS